jgi:pSer/pThr/pTyr-binding forkhead associated (FHA) protein
MKVIKVGRGYENDEVLNDSTVSRNHLEIFFGDDRLVVVTDLNSANGTTVNGKKINEPTKLDSLDILKAGNSLINWKNYLKDNNDSNNEISPEIKQKDDIKENDYNSEPKSKNIIQNYMKQLIVLLIISFSVIILVFFKSKFKEVKESVAIIDKVETLYTNLVEPLISNFTPQKKQRTDITYDFTCLNNNPENDIINGLGDFKRSTDEIFLSDVKVSINDEIKMGNSLLKSYQSEYTVIKSGKEVNYLSEILNDLSIRIANPRGFNYQIYYVKGKPDNIITSGGKIFVFEKFYKRFNNSSEIAAVLAHEIAHNEIGHLTSYVKKQKAANEFGLFGEIFLELEKVLTPPSFNQKQEVQADLFGIDLVQVSKYDSCRSIDFWQRLADDERQYDSYDNLMNSHPYSSSRKKCLKNHIKFNYNVICN